MGGLPPGAVPKRLHRLAQLCLLRLGLQQLLQRRQGPQPSVRGGEYRPGVQAAANVVAGHQGVHIGVVKEQPARHPHAQQHPEPAEVPVPHLPQGGCQEHRQHGHPPIGQHPLKGQPIGPHIEVHAPQGGYQHHAAGRHQECAQHLHHPEPPPLTLAESKAGQQAGQIDRGYGHKLEKTAAGIARIADSHLGQVVSAAEQRCALHRQKEGIQDIQHCQDGDRPCGLH